jgi:hypothetical protein
MLSGHSWHRNGDLAITRESEKRLQCESEKRLQCDLALSVAAERSADLTSTE